MLQINQEIIRESSDSIPQCSCQGKFQKYFNFFVSNFLATFEVSSAQLSSAAYRLGASFATFVARPTKKATRVADANQMLLNHIYHGQVLSSRPNETETQPRAEPEAEAEGTGGRQDTRAASALCAEVHLKDFLFDFPLLLLFSTK